MAVSKIITAARSLSQRGIDFIKRHEGLRLEKYADPVGLLTIGYGHLIKPGENFPNRLTPAEAEALLRSDTEKAQSAVRVGVKVPLTQNEFDALVSLVFNIGTGAFQNSTLLRLLNQGFKAAASEQFLVWRFAGGKPILLKRREQEKALFDTPERVT